MNAPTIANSDNVLDDLLADLGDSPMHHHAAHWVGDVLHVYAVDHAALVGAVVEHVFGPWHGFARVEAELAAAVADEVVGPGEAGLWRPKSDHEHRKLRLFVRPSKSDGVFRGLSRWRQWVERHNDTLFYSGTGFDLRKDYFDAQPSEPSQPLPAVPSAIEGSGAEVALHNRAPVSLPAEIALAREIGVRPVEPGTPEARDMVRRHGLVKGVVVLKGWGLREVRLIPVGQTRRADDAEGPAVEFSEAVAVNGDDVALTFTARMRTEGDVLVADVVAPGDGHYDDGTDRARTARTVREAKRALARYGVRVEGAHEHLERDRSPPRFGALGVLDAEEAELVRRALVRLFEERSRWWQPRQRPRSRAPPGVRLGPGEVWFSPSERQLARALRRGGTSRHRATDVARRVVGFGWQDEAGGVGVVVVLADHMTGLRESALLADVVEHERMHVLGTFDDEGVHERHARRLIDRIADSALLAPGAAGIAGTGSARALPSPCRLVGPPGLRFGARPAAVTTSPAPLGGASLIFGSPADDAGLSVTAHVVARADIRLRVPADDPSSRT